VKRQPLCARTLRAVARWHGRQAAAARRKVDEARKADPLATMPYQQAIDVNHTFSARHFERQAKRIEKAKR